MSEPVGWLVNEDIRVPLYKNRVVAFGRLPCTKKNNRIERVQINNFHISSTHCYIWIIQFDSNTSSVCYIQDVSINGTYVNKSKIGMKNYAILNHLDIIKLYNGIGFQYIKNVKNNNISTPSCTTIKDWNIMPEIIGIGTFGKVQIAYNNHEIGKFYAVKILEFKDRQVDNEKFKIEHKILSSLNHFNIIKIKQSLIDTSKLGTLNIFQNLAIGGDLFSYLSQDNDSLQNLSESESIFALYQICNGLNYLHQNGIVHRDLKLDNILIMSAPIKYPHLVIGDFGIAKKFNSANIRSNNLLMKTMVGTAEYAAPEIDLNKNLRKKKPEHNGGVVGKNIEDFFINNGEPKSVNNAYYTEKVDSWSLGVVGHILFSGISPFYSNNIEEIIKLSKIGEINLNNQKWQGVSEISKNFIRGCLQVDSNKRLSIPQCLGSEMFKQGDRKRLIDKLQNELLK